MKPPGGVPTGNFNLQEGASNSQIDIDPRNNSSLLEGASSGG